MRTLSKEEQEKITPQDAIRLLKEGNKRFIQNLKLNRNLLQQANETRDSQHPFAVIISCMDSRTSAELIFDQGLGDIFSIRIAGNVVTEEILGSAEFGCKVVGAKVIVVLGHSKCGAIKGAIDDVDLGHLHSITRKIQRCIPTADTTFKSMAPSDQMAFVTKANVQSAIEEIRSKSSILSGLQAEGKLAIIGGVYDISAGVIEFFE
jgi:carbonic anhydrase